MKWAQRQPVHAKRHSSSTATILPPHRFLWLPRSSHSYPIPSAKPDYKIEKTFNKLPPAFLNRLGVSIAF
jgi:hypothetical protein